MLVLQLKRIGPAFDRIYRVEQNSNLEKIEQANNTLETKMDSLISGEIDDVALQTDIEQKLNDLETQYAPKLTEVSEKLTDNEGNLNDRAMNVKTPPAPLLGVKGDGITDDTAALNNLISVLSANGGGELFYPTASYVIKGRLLLKSDVSHIGVNGSVIDLSQREGWDNGGFEDCIIQGKGEITNGQLLIVDNLKDTGIISVANTSLYTKGELLFLTSNSVWVGDSNPAKIGEFVVVKSIDNGTQITVSTKTHDNYLVSDNAQLFKVSPIKNVAFKNLKFVGKGAPTSADNTSGQMGLGIAYGKNISFEKCVFEKIDQVSLDLCSVYGFSVRDCYFEHEKNNTTHTQYQLRISSASIFGNVENVSCLNSRHSIVFGHNTGYNGINRYITVKNCNCKGTWHAAIGTHNSSEYLTIENNYINGCEVGINIREKNSIVINNTIVSCAQGIHLTKRARHLTIDGNVIKNSTNGIYGNGFDSDVLVEGIKITNNTIDTIAGSGIYIVNMENNVFKKSLLIKRNFIKDGTEAGNNAGIRINGAYGGEIKDNTLIRAGNVGIFLHGNCRYFDIQNNNIEGGSRSLRMENTVTKNIFKNNTLSNYSSESAILAGSGAGHIIESNNDLGSVS